LTDYIRAETMMSYLLHETQITWVPFLNSTLNVKVLAPMTQIPLLTVSFDKTVKIENDMGIMGDSIDDPKKYIVKQDNWSQVKLSSLKQNSTLIDVFDWIVNVLQLLSTSERGSFWQLIDETQKKIYNGNWVFVWQVGGPILDTSI